LVRYKRSSQHARALVDLHHNLIVKTGLEASFQGYQFATQCLCGCFGRGKASFDPQDLDQQEPAGFQLGVLGKGVTHPMAKESVEH
jgi:hypothetical protein